MTMPPALRRLLLTAHITVSVGWMGAVAAYLVLVVAAMTGQDEQTLRAAWMAMNLTGSYALVPLSLTALLTGLIMALGTKWGLFQHYWVLLSLVLTVVATVVLVQHMQTVGYYAGLTIDTPGIDGRVLRSGLDSELLHAAVGLLVLLVVQVLNVYKPRGLTPYGWRRQNEQRRGVQQPGSS
jgi:hypothetical protein